MQNNSRSMSRFKVSFEELLASCFPGFNNTFFNHRFCVCIDSALEIATKWDKTEVVENLRGNVFKCASLRNCI